MKIDGNKIILYFDYPDGLKSRDGKSLTHFEIAQIHVEFFPCGMAVDPQNDLLFVLNEASRSISMIDTKTNQLIKNILIEKERYMKLKKTLILYLNY